MTGLFVDKIRKPSIVDFMNLIFLNYVHDIIRFIKILLLKCHNDSGVPILSLD